jgi:hypothetical protein
MLASGLLFCCFAVAPTAGLFLRPGAHPIQHLQQPEWKKKFSNDRISASSAQFKALGSCSHKRNYPVPQKQCPSGAETLSQVSSVGGKRA